MAWIQWNCDECDARLDLQSGFTTSTGTWQCACCGAINDVTDANIIGDEGRTIVRNDGTQETIRYTKYRVVYDFKFPNGEKGSSWEKR